MDQSGKRVWLIILFIITIVLLIRFSPKIGYLLLIITLLVILFKYKQGKLSTKK